MNADLSLMVRDGLTGLAWIGVNILLGNGVWRLANQLAPNDTLAGRVLHASTLFCAIVTSVLVVLGTVGLFIGPAILSAAGTVSAAMYFISRRASPAGTPASVPAPSRGLLGWSVAFCLLAAHCVIHGLLTLPTDFDCLMYHLPLVDHWLQARSLYDPDFGQWSTPGGSELLAAWCCAPFSGDFLAPLNNLPVVVIWGAAGLEFCRLLNLGRGWAELATAASLTVYTLLHETDDASNDLLVVAGFMASAVYAIRCAVSQERKWLVMTGISLGLLYGVKYFAVGYAAVVWGTFVVAILLTCGWRKALLAGLAVGLISFLFGGYWYARNFVVTGLPLYPMGNSDELAYPDLRSTSLFGNRHPELWPLFFRAIWRLAGPIHWAAVAASPAVLLGLLAITFRESRRSRSPRADLPWMMAGLLLAGSAAVLWITPFLVEDQPESLNHLRWAYTPLRYGLCFFSMAVLCGFAVVNALCRELPRFASWSVFAGLTAVELWQVVHRVIVNSREFSFVEPVLLGLDLAIGGYVFHALFRRLPGLRWKTTFAFAGCLPLAVGIGLLSDRWHAGYVRHFDRHLQTDAFSVLDADEFDGDRICVLFIRPYPFFGSRREHHVINPRRYVSAAWLEELAYTDRFQLVAAYANHGYAVYRFNGAAEYLEQSGDKIQYLTGSFHLRLGLIRPGPETPQQSAEPLAGEIDSR